MSFREDYEAFFGIDNLVRYDETVINNLTIPSYSKRFLIDIGLPKAYYSEGWIAFNVLQDVPLLGAAFGDVYSLPHDYLAYRVFCTTAFEDIGIGGDNVICFYCLDEQTSGRVIQVRQPFGGPWVAGLLNSSIPQFAEFLLTLRQFDHWLWQRAVEEDRSGRPFRRSEVDLRSRLILRRLKRIDSEAITSFSNQGDYSSWEDWIHQSIIHCGSSL